MHIHIEKVTTHTKSKGLSIDDKRVQGMVTFLKYFNVSGLRSHISVMRQMAVRRTPLFFSVSRARVQGMNISISSGTLRTILKAQSAA